MKVNVDVDALIDALTDIASEFTAVEVEVTEDGVKLAPAGSFDEVQDVIKISRIEL